MIRVNLLPYMEEKKRESARRQTSILILTTTVVMVSLVSGHLYLMNESWSLDQRISQVRTDIKGLEAKIGEVDKFKADKVALETKLGIIEKLKINKLGPVRLMDELSNAVPSNVWLNSVKVKAGKLELGGVGLDNTTIANFMTFLERRDPFGVVELQVSENLKVRDIVLKSFRMSCPINGIGS